MNVVACAESLTADMLISLPFVVNCFDNLLSIDTIDKASGMPWLVLEKYE